MKLFVVKIGGNVIDDDKTLNLVLKNFTGIGSKCILVHGGGKIASQMATKLDITTQMVEGRRITDAPMRDVISMVYGGLVNKKIVSILQSMDRNAIGLSGADASLITAHKRPVRDIDYGFVGDIDHINSSFLQSILEMDLCPVIAPLSYNKADGLLNTNADTIASQVAISMSSMYETRLVYCFEKRGVLLDVNDDHSLILNLNRKYYFELKESKVIFEGMIPKIDNAFAAIDSGVKSVIICKAEELLEATQSGTTGTNIVA